ncbi:hypothetical protein A3J90_05365 [candidate division WOR-1 bacterium RIFOXYC2_FULL_37_10]|uniref:Polymerase beta nucleotidyltransferase domain-containing protein n=1 Tax=candidate division WOR-1 bacterium RIFOXYB2_FULL_37_13 TaxID=1802579 RepID=A0A1F4SUV4_UNCSA|nr:MAG: hypothetical protein A2310_06705 [candidate division WOR-1 bacterium RIFOXYB2_FULL_37_13]OGC36463.1 MAG: hypothetical protein A3J90_05365 [candidate division WOR-1 bacterium RIFOXYC2_FULL_37_10]
MRKIRNLNETEPMDFSELSSEFSKICVKNRIDILYLFGSMATQRQTALSDVDMAFYTKDGLSSDAKLKLHRDFSGLLKRDDIDLTDLKRANPLTSYKAIKEGVLLYCSDDELKQILEYKIQTKYLDTMYLREEFHRNLEKTIFEGNFYDKN